MSYNYVILRQTRFALLDNNITPRHVTGNFFLGIVYFCIFLIDYGLAENVTIIRNTRKDRAGIPELVPDQFTLPQSYCPNGVPKCDMFGAISSTIGSCLCTCNIRKHNAATFGFVDNVWRCRNDTLLRRRSDDNCTLRFESENRQSGIRTFKGAKRDYFSNLKFLNSRKCKIRTSTSRILQCDDTWKALSKPVDRLDVRLENGTRYYFEARRTSKKEIYREIRGRVMKVGISCKDSNYPFGSKSYCVLIKFKGNIVCPITSVQTTGTTLNPAFTSSTDKEATLRSSAPEISKTEGTLPLTVRTGTETFVKKNEGDEENGRNFQLPALVGGVAGFAVIVLLVIVVIVMRRRTKKKRSRNNRTEAVYEEPTEILKGIELYAQEPGNVDMESQGRHCGKQTKRFDPGFTNVGFQPPRNGSSQDECDHYARSEWQPVYHVLEATHSSANATGLSNTNNTEYSNTQESAKQPDDQTNLYDLPDDATPDETANDLITAREEAGKPDEDPINASTIQNVLYGLYEELAIN